MADFGNKQNTANYEAWGKYNGKYNVPFFEVHYKYGVQMKVMAHLSCGIVVVSGDISCNNELCLAVLQQPLALAWY